MDTQKRTLNELANAIEAEAKSGDERLFATATLVRELKERVEAGEGGDGKTWSQWARANVNLSPSRLYQLNAIARASDPKAELERQRKIVRDRVERFRKREIGARRALERERREMIEWAKSAEFAEVQKIWRQIGRIQRVRPLLPKSPEVAPRDRVH